MTLFEHQLAELLSGWMVAVWLAGRPTRASGHVVVVKSWLGGVGRHQSFEGSIAVKLQDTKLEDYNTARTTRVAWLHAARPNWLQGYLLKWYASQRAAPKGSACIIYI